VFRPRRRRPPGHRQHDQADDHRAPPNQTTRRSGMVRSRWGRHRRHRMPGDSGRAVRRRKCVTCPFRPWRGVQPSGLPAPHAGVRAARVEPQACT
jgi:hypothetical protein